MVIWAEALEAEAGIIVVENVQLYSVVSRR